LVSLGNLTRDRSFSSKITWKSTTHRDCKISWELSDCFCL